MPSVSLPPRLRRRPAAAAALLVALLAGCAPLQTRQTLQAAADAARQHAGAAAELWRDPAAAQSAQQRIDALLAHPLSADDAVRIALLGSPAVQALLAQAAADSARATAAARLGNPVLSLERLTQGDALEISRGIAFGLLDLLTLPTRQNLDAAQQQRVRLALTREVLAAASAARATWVRAVAAQQLAAYDADTVAAAQATAELARRMQAAGNFTALDAARQALFATDAQLAQQRDQLAALAAREALVRALGLSSEQAAQLKLPDRLPDPPAGAAALQSALDQRLDVQLAQAEVETAAQAAGLTRATSAVEPIELGYTRNTYSDAAPQQGPRLALTLPLFDLGDARRSAAADALLAARSRAIATARTAASQLRQAQARREQALQTWQTARAQLLPLAQTVLDQSQLRYNGMLIGTFELVAAAQTQVQAVRAALAAQRDAWLAQLAWDDARLGLPSFSPSPDLPAAALPAAAAGH
ncbi:MAG: TolC family protein [Thiomonas sp.]